jgi:alkylation response protein AidB-like acyl-CoA dehydrogenase
MELELTDEQRAFQSTARRFIEAEGGLGMARALYDSPRGFDKNWWRWAAGELGWTSLFVPERFGGGTLSGRPTADAAIVAEELGRLVAPGPFLPVSVVAAALGRWGMESQADEMLPALVNGTSVATWAFAESGCRWDPQSFDTSARIDDAAVLVSGEKWYVEAAGAADLFLVTARTPGGVTHLLVPATTPGVTVVAGRSVDMTRRFGRVQFNDVRLPRSAVLGSEAGPEAAWVWLVKLALALQCAEMVGLAEQALLQTVAYGRDRIAFGRPVVSFQVIKHRIADMSVSLEGMKAVTEALIKAVDDETDGEPGLASAAKAYVGGHCLDIVDDCVQITGGLGVTWEHDIHLYNRRAVVDRAMYGSPEDHRAHLVKLLREEAA